MRLLMYITHNRIANYGYGGGYTATSYGAQGGAEGGGFLNGSQAGSQDSPGGNSKVYLLYLS